MSKFIVFVVLAGVLAVVYTLIEARLIRVNRQSVISDKLPKQFDGYSIAFISDLHNYSKSGKRIRRVVDIINSLTY